MRSTDFYLAERTMEMRVEEELRQAQARRVAHEAMPLRLLSLSQPVRRLVCDLSRFLVALGGRLVRYGLPAYSPVEVPVSDGRRRV
jgi:hypothetical protein